MFAPNIVLREDHVAEKKISSILFPSGTFWLPSAFLSFRSKFTQAFIVTISSQFHKLVYIDRSKHCVTEGPGITRVPKRHDDQKFLDYSELRNCKDDTEKID